MNPFQDVAFRNVQDFLDYLPDGEAKLVESLRHLVFECIPDVQEKLAYNVPFYYRYSRICFIWPGSVPWGKTQKAGVEFGFCKGHLLSDSSYLNKGSRKEVYIKTFYHLKEIETDVLRSLLYEAVALDDEDGRLKKTAKRGKKNFW